MHGSRVQGNLRKSIVGDRVKSIWDVVKLKILRPQLFLYLPGHTTFIHDENGGNVKMSNRLKYEKSPYLLQHQDNPVNWYPWCDEAFKRAYSEDKPIFLSIGYSTCHWCHVMAHESFEDEEVAELLNKNYICIKVDREERPDIDAVYMSVCQRLTGAGGWPLTIVMTPEQMPFFAGTYFPKRRRFGQEGLKEILEKISELWEHHREKLTTAGEEIAAAVKSDAAGEESLNSIAGKREPDSDLLHEAFRQLRGQYDEDSGGFGRPPKFPMPHQLLFLMRYAFSEAVPEAMRMAEETLNAMARGGIYDHIGGGFSRYSTDERWLVPHFEKMLYDNALLILAYLNAFQATRKKEYADAAKNTADYILRELKDPRGGFYCGQDADSDGVEGKYYVFTPEEIKGVLGERDGTEYCALYGITQEGNFDGKSIPNRIGHTAVFGWRPEDERVKRLYRYRSERARLHKDTKILLSWNAWTIIALLWAGQLLEERKYLEAAVNAERFLRENMTDEKGRLYLRYCGGEAAHAGQLTDYAVYALALLELYRGTLKAEYLREAIIRAEQMQKYFEDRRSGGYYITASDAEVLITRPKEVYDGAVPSGNSVAAAVLCKTAALTGEKKWQEAADRQLQFLAEKVRDYPAGHCFSLFAFAGVLYPHKELVCAVKDGIPRELAQYLKKTLVYGLNVLVKTEENEEELAQCAPYTKAYPIPESGAVYYLCKNGACAAPITEFCELVNEM